MNTLKSRIYGARFLSSNFKMEKPREAQLEPERVTEKKGVAQEM